MKNRRRITVTGQLASPQFPNQLADLISSGSTWPPSSRNRLFGKRFVGPEIQIAPTMLRPSTPKIGPAIQWMPCPLRHDQLNSQPRSARIRRSIRIASLGTRGLRELDLRKNRFAFLGRETANTTSPGIVMQFKTRPKSTTMRSGSSPST